MHRGVILVLVDRTLSMAPQWDHSAFDVVRGYFIAGLYGTLIHERNNDPTESAPLDVLRVQFAGVRDETGFRAPMLSTYEYLPSSGVPRIQLNRVGCVKLLGQHVRPPILAHHGSWVDRPRREHAYSQVRDPKLQAAGPEPVLTHARSRGTRFFLADLQLNGARAFGKLAGPNTPTFSLWPLRCETKSGPGSSSPSLPGRPWATGPDVLGARFLLSISHCRVPDAASSSSSVV